MTAEHPIAPPPELVEQWYKEWLNCDYIGLEGYIATQAARWGADTELEACINEIYKGVGLRHVDYSSNRESLCSDLRAARRPKPPSLKERALQAWAVVEAGTDDQTAMAVIRRALEALPE